MGLFRNIGRQVGQFTDDAKKAAEDYTEEGEEPDRQCADCGARFGAGHETCPDCGSAEMRTVTDEE